MPRPGKAFVLTEAGKAYAAPLLDSINKIEARAVALIGEENIREMAQAAAAFSDALEQAMKENT